MIKLRIKGVDRMSKGIVIFDSNYGNTEKVAKALATGIKQGGVETDCVSINGADVKKLIFCFDTRNPSRFNAFDMNSAAKRIEKKMKKMNVKIIRPRESALVEGREGPLHDGVLERFRRIGTEIAESF
jgi:hypothetical protein